MSNQTIGVDLKRPFRLLSRNYGDSAFNLRDPKIFEVINAMESKSAAAWATLSKAIAIAYGRARLFDLELSHYRSASPR